MHGKFPFQGYIMRDKYDVEDVLPSWDLTQSLVKKNVSFFPATSYERGQSKKKNLENEVDVSGS